MTLHLDVIMTYYPRIISAFGFLSTVTLNAEPPSILRAGNLTNPDRIEALTGTPLTFQILASENPSFYTASGLPSNFSLNPLTGVISGFTNSATSSTVTITATNADGQSEETSIPMNVFSREDSFFEGALDVGNNNRTPFTQGQSNTTTLREFFQLLGGNNADQAIGNDRIRTEANLGFDNEQVTGINDVTNNYSTVSVNLSAGLHALEWQFHSTGSGNHAGWLDNVQVSGYPVWAGLGAFNSDLNLDTNQDSFTLLEEYALGLSPSEQKDVEAKTPSLTFDSQGHAFLAITRSTSTVGVNVDIEQNDSLNPDTWGMVPLVDLSSGNTVLKRENEVGQSNFFRVNITAP